MDIEYIYLKINHQTEYYPEDIRDFKVKIDNGAFTFNHGKFLPVSVTFRGFMNYYRKSIKL